jgi:hypothetical protein
MNGLYFAKCAPVLGMSVLLMSGVGTINPQGVILRLREPLGTVDIELDNGEIRYCVTNDPYATVYWAKA